MENTEPTTDLDLIRLLLDPTLLTAEIEQQLSRPVAARDYDDEFDDDAARRQGRTAACPSTN